MGHPPATANGCRYLSSAIRCCCAGRDARSPALVNRRLFDPLAQRLLRRCRAAAPPGESTLGVHLVGAFDHHSDGTLTKLRRMATLERSSVV